MLHTRNDVLSRAESWLRSSGAPVPSDGMNSVRPAFTVVLSREAGAMGTSVAEELGRRLDWPVYDKNILDKLGEALERPGSRLEPVDERPSNWLGEVLAHLFDKYHVGADVYLKHLFAAVRTLGEAGRCVLVGRGANFILPVARTLRVRLVADPADRAAALAKRFSVSMEEAVKMRDAMDRDRSKFVRQRFHEDAADPHHYDLVLNLSRMSVAEAADVILEALHRFEKREAVVVAANREPAMATMVG